ncbi:Protein of unknown function [Bacillus mycoides]|nr:Protein of unknown function [Bacillus mycoides]
MTKPLIKVSIYPALTARKCPIGLTNNQ